MKKAKGRSDTSVKLKSKVRMRSGMMGPMMFEINEITKKVNKMTETSCLFFITLPLAILQPGLPKVQGYFDF